MTTNYQIIYWRDIPAQVRVKAESKRVGRPLPQRFPVAIDEAAMRAGLTESDAYLAEWRKSDWMERGGELEEVADALVKEFEAAYPAKRLQTLVEQHGLEKSAE